MVRHQEGGIIAVKVDDAGLWSDCRALPALGFVKVEEGSIELKFNYCVFGF